MPPLVQTSHYPNQTLAYCYLHPKEYISIIFYLKFQFFFQGNAFEIVVCKIVAILSRPQCVNMYMCIASFDVVYMRILVPEAGI